MSLLKYDPFRALADIDKLMCHPIMREIDGSSIATSQWNPAADISETPHAFLVHMDLPGVDKKHIQVSVEGGYLEIRGHREETKESDSKQVHRRERLVGDFYRRFALAESADVKNIKAEFKDGVLNLEIPKIEKAKAEFIEVL